MSISSIPSSATSSTCSCQNCGMMTLVGDTGFSVEAQKRIEELEQQVKEYSMRAAVAADKLATSQDELLSLQRKIREGNSVVSSPAQQTPSSPPRAAVGRITAFLNGRSSPSSGASGNPNSATPSPAARPSSPGASAAEDYSKQTSTTNGMVTELELQLSKERSQKEEAETQLAKVTNELEELSASLFQQANEMVSTERRARAKLEERVAQLEKRDMDKEMRLETLEKALQRINRVRGILSETKK